METLLEVKNLIKYFPVKGGFFRRTVGHVKAVDGVTFSLEKGKTLGVVGESGCGKSTLGRAILRLIDSSEGEVLFNGTNILHLSYKEMFPMRRKMQIIFQDPFASLNPRKNIRQIIIEPLNTHKIGTPDERQKTVVNLMDLVGLRKDMLERYPHEFSGGQRQRIGIARALALHPDIIIADEPLSALDVSVQSQVLNLMKDLQEKLGISYIFISHDLAVIEHISHDIAVMYLGKIVEKAATESLFKNRKHPYTEALLSAIPVPDPNKKSSRIILSGDVPSPLNPPSGCPFHPRCPRVMDICRSVIPEYRNTGNDEDEHFVSCHLYNS